MAQDVKAAAARIDKVAGGEAHLVEEPSGAELAHHIQIEGAAPKAPGYGARCEGVDKVLDAGDITRNQVKGYGIHARARERPFQRLLRRLLVRYRRRQRCRQAQVLIQEMSPRSR